MRQKIRDLLIDFLVENLREPKRAVHREYLLAILDGGRPVDEASGIGAGDRSQLIDNECDRVMVILEQARKEGR